MYGVIMAGGVGSRFWPFSSEKRPKQFLNIFGEKPLIRQTFDRLLPIIKQEDIYIVTNAVQKAGLVKLIPELNLDNIIVEPIGKNTAPCIGLAALYIKRIDPDGVMAVMPSDHLIEDDEKFRQVLLAGEKLAAESNCLVTIGICPTRPATGYGYIQFNRKIGDIDGIPAYEVKTFAEKPDLKTAKSFLESGDFLWNSGVFLWKTSVILKEIEKSLPELYDSLMEIDDAIDKPSLHNVIKRVYRQIRSISIDYGVMEKAERVCVLKGEFGWKDVGSWEEVYNIMEKDEEGNAVEGDHMLKDVKGCLIYSPSKLVAVIGLENVIVVQSKDATLICHRSRAQEVRDVVEFLRRKKMSKYL